VVRVNFIGCSTGFILRSVCSSDAEFALLHNLVLVGDLRMPGIAVYSATKHAVKGLTEALSIEFRRYGVRAADTLPGLIDTAILPEGTAERAPKEGMFRLIQPIEVAKIVWEAYNSDKLHWYVPEEIGDLDKARATILSWCASRSCR